jgi:hypothetical protein
MKFIEQLVSRHMGRYPGMQLEDIYKLLHQAALGPGHAVKDMADARARLDTEAAALGDGPDEPARDIISPDGKLARIHLRPFLASGGNLQDLCAAFVETANSYPPSPEKLAKFCGCLGDLAAAGGVPWPKQDVVVWFDRIAESGYPPVHHSQKFTENYRPAYRVVSVDFLK